MINQSTFTEKPMLLFLDIWYNATNISASQSMAAIIMIIAIWLLSACASNIIKILFLKLQQLFRQFVGATWPGTIRFVQLILHVFLLQ